MAWISGNNLKNDWLIGTSGNDVIKGYGGSDVLKGGGGADHLDGGAGIDAAMYVDSPTGVYVDLWTGRGYYGTAEGDTLINIEDIYGSSYGDYLIGNNDHNYLYGLDGDDVLEGGGSWDMLDGGSGYDMVSYLHASNGVRAAVNGSGYEDNSSYADWLINIEALQGSAYGDELVGDHLANKLYGEGGDDALYGGGGDDELRGGYGNDQLYGREGNDLMYGEVGQDRLEGGPGIDTMYGGLHADTFAWSFISDTGTTMSTSDLVLDFNPAEGDRLDLSAVDADVYASGDQAFMFIGSAPLSGTSGEINYFHADGDTYIQLQAAGTSMPVMFCLDGIRTPETSWFVL